MIPSGKRTIVLVCAAGCILASAALFTLGRAGHSGAVHVPSTLVVDAAGQRLSGFFDGLPSDPRNNIALLTLLQNPRRRCGDGFWQRLLERVEGVAYAQTNDCNIPGCDGPCQGNLYVQSSQWCFGDACNPGTQYPWAYLDAAKGDPNLGWIPGCNPGCGGAPGCPCQSTTCPSGSQPPPPPPPPPPAPQCYGDPDCTDLCEHCFNNQCVPSGCSPLCCHHDWECVSGKCTSGCCEIPSGAGGCVWDSGYSCGSCGTIVCDGSCDDPCGCVWNSGYSCGSCGTVQCDGSCDDSCPGGGGDACGGCPDGSSCFEAYYSPEHMFLIECYVVDPVVLSLDGSLFPLTNVANGVRFDFYGDNKPPQISWTAAGAKVGWLALDLNGDGLINNGLELFSNATSQPGKAGTHLGFRAIAQWDKPTMGGNGDGQITSKDYVFSRLRVWVDSNHNGISEPGELLTMQQAGIQAISAHYLPDHWTDQYGNRFQNRAQVTWSNQNHGNGKGQGSGGGRDQWAYDVVLLSTTAK